MRESEYQRQYRGACHCGAIEYRYTTDIPPASWSVRADQCSFCKRHGAACTSDPAGSVEFIIKKPAALNRYRFGLRTADFLVCKRCGIYVAAVITTPNGSWAIVNINALDDPPAELPHPEPVSYEGETVEERVRRRKERWTPVTGEG